MIDVKEILKKHHCTLDTMFPTKMENINSAIKEIVQSVLKEAVNNAETETYYPNPYTDEHYERVNEKSITSIINKVKF